MKHLKEKVGRLVHKSKEIISDSALENGAIVAGNSDKAYYPKAAKDYHYVWPRQAAFICAAAQLVGIDTIQEPFFGWLTERPEDFKKEGKLFNSYTVNGRIRLRQFEPDQAGTVLWAIHQFYQKTPSHARRQEALIRRLADGLADDWQEKYFFTNTVDLWGETKRQTSTLVENNHTYSLAACAHGLRRADAMLKNDRWKRAADQMALRLNDAYRPKQKMFVRNHGQIDDPNVDASLLGLTFPFTVVEPTDERMRRTVERIEATLVANGGVHRYQFDYYDGEGSAQEGGGAWPLLNCWLAIYWVLAGDTTKAMRAYQWVVERVGDDELIPEQVFQDSRQGVKPLAWSHAMFIFASYHLGLLP